MIGLCGCSAQPQLAGRAEEAVAAARGGRGRPRPRQPLLDRVRASRPTHGPSPRRTSPEPWPPWTRGSTTPASTGSRSGRRPRRDAARLEAVLGDPEQALALFDTALEYFHRAGDLAQLPSVFAYLAGFFDRFGAPEVAATVYGASTHGRFNSAPSVATRLRSALGDAAFDQAVAAGAAMDTGEAVRYARQQIRHARRQQDELS